MKICVRQCDTQSRALTHSPRPTSATGGIRRQIRAHASFPPVPPYGCGWSSTAARRRYEYASESTSSVSRAPTAVSSAPAHGLDVGPLLPYVSALDDERLPPAQFKWTSRHSARITAPLVSNQLVSVQISYDPRWRAIVNGSPRGITSDALGLMLIEPECAGSCLIELDYDPGKEMVLRRAVQIASFISLLTGVLVFRQTQVPPSIHT